MLACGATTALPQAAGTGAHPVLPPPTKSLIPVVNVVTAKGWAPNATPMVADGMSVAAFARGLDHPRWLYVLPNGDVLVDANGGAMGRPVGVAMDKGGALLVADDVGNAVWRVTKRPM